MTSPTIISTPGAIDEAASNFLHAFTLARQLSNQHQQMLMEQQKTQAQVAESGARAGEANALRKQHEQETENSQNQVLGARVAASFAPDAKFSDDGAWQQHLNDAQVPDELRPYASQARQATLTASADLRKRVADAQEEELKVAAEKQTEQRHQQIGDLIGQYQQGKFGRGAAGLLGFAVHAAAIDPAMGKSAVDAIAPQGDFDLKTGGYLLDKKRGTVTKLPGMENYGMSGLGGVVAQRLQFGAHTSLMAIQDLSGIVQRRGMQGIMYPTQASGLKGLADVGVFGFHPLKGLAGPAEKEAMQKDQQAAQAAYAQLGHGIASLLGGSRSMALYNSILSAYAPQAGHDPATVAHLYQKTLALIPYLQSMEQGHQVDYTKLPGFKDFQGDLVKALQDEPADGDAGQLPLGDYNAGVPQ